jgi:hypothetical protein
MLPRSGRLAAGRAKVAFRSRKDADLSRLAPEGGTVVHREAGLRLPLVHHLMQQGVLHLGPGVAGDVATTDGDLDRPPGPELNAQLAESRPHPAREPERQTPEDSAEMLGVEPLVGLAQAVEQPQVARTRTLAPLRPWRSRRMPLHRKIDELTLSHAPLRPWQAGVEEPDDGLEDPVRRVGIPSMQPQHPARTEAYHDDPIGVGDDSGDAAKAQQAQAGGQGIRAHNP